MLIMLLKLVINFNIKCHTKSLNQLTKMSEKLNCQKQLQVLYLMAQFKI